MLQLHKSIGFTVLGLAILRLMWRLARRPPALPEGMQPWERLAAKATHWTFYFIIFVMPITGWIIVSASPTNIPTLLYKTIPFPHLGFIHELPMGDAKNPRRRRRKGPRRFSLLHHGLDRSPCGGRLEAPLLEQRRGSFMEWSRSLRRPSRA